MEVGTRIPVLVVRKKRVLATRRRVQLEVDASTFVTMTSTAIDTDVFETNPYEDHPSLTTLEADVLWEYAKLSQHVKIVGNSWFHLIHHKLTTKRVKLVAKTRQLSEEPDKTLLNQLRVLETKMGLVMTLVGGKTVDREKICVTESFDSSKHRCGVLSMSNLCQILLHLSTSHPIQQSEDNFAINVPLEAFIPVVLYLYTTCMYP